MRISTFSLAVVALLISLAGMVALNNAALYFALGCFILSVPLYMATLIRFIKEIHDAIQDKGR